MFLIDRRYLRSFDWLSFVIIMLLSMISLAFVFSSTYQPEQPYSIFLKKQAFGVVSGLIIYIIMSSIDYRTLMRWGYFIYFAVLALLAFTLMKGIIGMGGQRWIQLSFFRLQPSELAKLFFPAFFTHYLYTQRDTFKYVWQDFTPVLAIILATFVLIRKQPDLGTALIVLFSGLILLWLAGINKRFFIISFLCIGITAPISWNILKPYQKKRILVFLGYGDKHKERYQIEQSKIAIGSGGMFGKGLLSGTQNRLKFLPECHTDFIFPVIAEEFGFVGTFSILLLYFILFIHIIHTIKTFSSPFMQLLATGLIIHIILSVIINIGMVIDLLPVTGIPLPLISYGLSNLWVTYASLGWINSISMQQYYSLK